MSWSTSNEANSSTAKQKLDEVTWGDFAAFDYMSGLVLFCITYISRFLTRGSVYMVDGPRLVEAIRTKTYVIQPPGYWLFAHLGGMFSDPATGLAFWNRFFSSAGTFTMYFLCRKLNLKRSVCWSASLAYGSIFFVWFAGDTHSSYPSQILFAPLGVLVAILYRQKAKLWILILWAAVFSFGAGLRPSDGAFLLPLHLYLAYRLIKINRDRLVWGAALTAFCLVWYLPTHAALTATNGFSYTSSLSEAFRQRSILLAGITPASILNISRVLLPLFGAFWMLLPAYRASRYADLRTIVAIWIIPGTLFLLSIYMADADYLCFCSGAFILAAASAKDSRRANFCLGTCGLWNSTVFLFAHPVTWGGNVMKVIDFYVIKYCHYGIVHQWTSTLGRGGVIPR